MEKSSASVIGPILVSFIIVVVLTVIILTSGLGIGFLLHWLLPAIDVGVGTIAGLVSLCIATFIYVKLTSLVLDASDEDRLLEDNLNDKEEQILEVRTPIIHLVRPSSSSRRNKRK